MPLRLIEPLDKLLHDVWEEASARATVDGDALIGLWERLEQIHAEIGTCSREFQWNLDELGPCLQKLKDRAHAELERVRAGELDVA